MPYAEQKGERKRGTRTTLAQRRNDEEQAPPYNVTRKLAPDGMVALDANEAHKVHALGKDVRVSPWVGQQSVAA